MPQCPEEFLDENFFSHKFTGRSTASVIDIHDADSRRRHLYVRTVVGGMMRMRIPSNYLRSRPHARAVAQLRAVALRPKKASPLMLIDTALSYSY